MPETFKANNYINRQDLEKAVKARVGLNAEKNRDAGHVIQGKREELKQLHLSDTTEVWGVKVKITDKPTEEVLQDKVNKIKKSEIKK